MTNVDRVAEYDAASTVFAALQAAGLQPSMGVSSVITLQLDGIPYQVNVRDLRRTNIVYVRWHKDAPRVSEVYLPLVPDHPAYDEPCILCGDTLGNGQQVQLLVIGPRTHHDRVLHWLGEFYPAMALYLHHLCVCGVALNPPEEMKAPTA